MPTTPPTISDKAREIATKIYKHYQVGICYEVGFDKTIEAAVIDNIGHHIQLLLNSETKALRDEVERLNGELEQLKKDIDAEQVKYAIRAARSFVSYATKELDILTNAYIGHLCGMEAVVQERDTLKQQVEILKASLSAP